MALRTSSAPAWLFAFVDLAFLLLIALSQLGPDPTAVPLGELVVPRVAEAGTLELGAGAARRWQLRVFPAGDPPAFELVDLDGRSERVSGPELSARLEALLANGQGKPLVAPHENSRSADLLDAVARVEALWSARRRVAVEPEPAP